MSRREALSLYRAILRSTQRFHWCNEKGEPWSGVLRASTRSEYEAARHERDPLIVARLLVVGRQALHDAQQKFDDAEAAQVAHVGNTRTRESEQRR
jgi:hypothetical protein